MNDQQVSFIGQQLAERYQIERQIGQGNVGTLYRADDQRTQHAVAMKIFNGDIAPDSEAAQALLADARHATQLVSPNLVPTLDVGVHAGRFAFVVEPLLAGKSLARRFDEQGPLPVAQAVRVAIELLSALEVLHRADILHLDIKPANVFLIADPLGMERAVLGGIGTRHVLGLDQAPAKAKGVCLAQPEYIAPEIVSGKPLTRQTDIYQIGVLLYEMLTGRPPFPGSNFKATARRHALEKPVSPKLVRPQARIPDDLDQVVMQCLEKNAKRRFDNPTALARALETIAQTGFAAGDGQFRRTGGPTAAESERPDPDELAHAARAADAAKKAALAEAARLAAEAEVARLAAEAAIAKQAAEEAAAQAAEEAKKADAEAAAQKAADADAAQKAEAAKSAADAKAAKKAADAEAAKKAADAEAAKKAADDEAAKTVVDVVAIKPEASQTTPSSKTQSSTSRKKKSRSKKSRSKNRSTGSHKAAAAPASSSQPDKAPAKAEPEIAKTDKAPVAAAFGASAPAAKVQLDASTNPPAEKPADSSKGRAPAVTLSGDEGWFVDSTEELEEKHAKLSVYHFQEEKERSLFPFIIAGVVVVVGIIFLIVSMASEDPKTDHAAAATEAPAARTAVPATAAPRTTAPKTTAPKTTAPESTAPKSEAPESAAPDSAAPVTEAAAMPSTPEDIAAKKSALLAQGESAVTAARWPDVVAASKALRTMEASAEADALTRTGLKALLKTGAAQLKAESLPDALATAETALTLAPDDKAAKRLKADVEAAQKAVIAKAGADAAAAAALEAKQAEDARKAEAARTAAEAKAAADAAKAAEDARKKDAAAAAKAERDAEAARKKAEAQQAAAAKKADKASAAAARKAEAARKRAEAKKASAAKKAAAADARKAAAAKRAENRAKAAGVIKRAQSQLAAGQWGPAQKSFLEATRIDSTSAVAFAGLSEVAFQQQKFNEAVKFGKRAVRLSGRNATYRVQLGLSYFKLKQYAAAKKEWETALKIKPGHPAATKYLKIVKKRLGG